MLADELHQIGVVALEHFRGFGRSRRIRRIVGFFGGFGSGQASDRGKHGFFVDRNATLCVAFSEMDRKRGDDSDALVNIDQF